MRPENYSTLKSASKVAFSKDGDVVSLTEKSYDVNTGVANSDRVRKVDLNNYETDKAQLEAQKTSLEAEIAGLTAIIADIKAL
jgi:hypothetical protein